MTVEKDQDESSDFVCESEDAQDVESPAQEVEANEEQASSETDNTEADDSEDTSSESTEKEESDLPGTDTAAEDDKSKKPNRVQKRIDEVVRQREEEKRKNESLEARIKELEGKKQNDNKGSDKEPVEDDFETYDQYLDALDKFDKQSDQPSDNKSAPDKKEDNSKDKDELTSSQKTALAMTQERVASADKPDDFDSVALNPELPITGDMLEALAECDDPAKVMYHLGQNKDLAADIAVKSSVQQMRAIAKLDLTITSKPNKPTKITNAPDAITPVSGTDSQKKAPSEMSFAEFEADDRARNSQRKSTW